MVFGIFDIGESFFTKNIEIFKRIGIFWIKMISRINVIGNVRF